MSSEATELDSRPAARLAVALGLVLGLMATEIVVGVLARSLALLSDAAHMLTDAAALGAALVAMRLARRAPTGSLTFGLKRTEILSALFNGVTLLVLGLLIFGEGIARLVSPERVSGWPMLAVALAGIAVNLLATWQVSLAGRHSMNVHAALVHILTDIYAFAGTAVAAALVITASFDRADPIASLVIACVILWTALRLVRDAGRVLLEAAPAGLRIEDVGQALASEPGVTHVHDLHVWEITSGFPALSAHLLVEPNRDCHDVRRHLEVMLARRFGIDHTTLQVDHDAAHGALSIGRPAQRPGDAGT